MNTQTDTGPTATLEDLYDPAFREQVRDNDPSALAMLGLSQDHQPEIRVVTDRSDTLHISLPRELPDNLSAADLENISAGIGWHEFWRRVRSLFSGRFLTEGYLANKPGHGG
ncbi:MAG: hypothetical protein OXU71_00640 [Gammaproteobacteria bacterium]|nr:hypothetical protein [Gammaproteobacteria bacterium]